MSGPWAVPLAILAGAGFGAGLWLAVAALTGHLPTQAAAGERWPRRMRGPEGKRLLAAVLAGVLVLVGTRWVAVSIAVAAVVLAWRWLFGAAAEQRQVIARLEALASWVEALRDTIATGLALPEAIPATARAAPPVLARSLQELVARMQAREPLDRALLAFADDLDDAVADQAIAALALNARAQGRQLKNVLTALAVATRKQVDAQREVEAERAGIRQGVKIIMVVTVAFVLGTAVFNRGYAEPFSTPTGQLVLTLDMACFIIGFAWIRRLATFQTPARFLATPMVVARRAAGRGRLSHHAGGGR